MSYRILLAFVAIHSAGSAVAQSWDDAIENVSNAAEEYAEEYTARTGYFMPSGLAGINFKEHRCAILARMLGFSEYAFHFEEDYPPAAEARTDDLIYLHSTLDSWLAEARGTIEMPYVAKATIWNLECTVKHGLESTWIGIGEVPRADMFASDAGSETLLVIGDIDSDFYARLVKALDEHPTITTISLGSGGGDVVNALRAGVLIRNRGLDTTLHAECYSACPLVFVGGIKRIVWSQSVALGFHAFSTEDGALPDGHWIYADIANYLEFMGADADQIMPWIKFTAVDDMSKQVGDVLCETRLVTGVHRLCMAEGPDQ